MIEAALFDMDGLMIDSDSVISESYETVMKEYGKKPKLNERGIVHTPGISAIDNWKTLASTYKINEDISILVSKKSKLHESLIKKGVKSMPGLHELLILLKDKNIKIAIASSSKMSVIHSVVEHLDIQKYFDVIVSGEEVENGKPAPDIFLKAAHKLNVKPMRCVVLEDSINGVKAAKAGGMKCIAIPAPADFDNMIYDKATIKLHSLEDISWATIQNLSEK